MTRPSSKDRFRGCIVGAAIGDALGAPWEFTKSAQVDLRNDDYGVGVFNTKPGDATDDSTLLKFHAEAIIEGSVKHYYVESLKEWYLSKPPDMGGQTRAAIEAHIDGKPVPDTGSCGNGSLMAVAPAGLTAHDPITAGKRGYDFSMLTHPNELCKYICGIYSQAIYEVSRVDRTHYPVEVQPYPLWVSADSMQMGYAPVACALALSALRRAQGDVILDGPGTVGFKALKWVIERGGDTDTNASITGGLLGAAYGMDMWQSPGWLTDSLVGLDSWIDLADRLYDATQ